MDAKITKTPKAAAALIADAEAAGYTVNTEMLAAQFGVGIQTPRGDSVTVYWSVTNTAPLNSRLGFATSFRAGVRFWYGTAHLTHRTWDRHTGKDTHYPQINSVRDARAALGLAI